MSRSNSDTTDTSTTSGGVGRILTARNATTVKPKRLSWLVPNWIPASALTLIAGREGVGKSTIAADLAAQATVGKMGKSMSVLYVSIEDSRALVTVPRLYAAGADMNRVDFLDVTAGGHVGTLDLPRDTHRLESLITTNDYGLVVLDPVTAVLSGTLNPNHAADVRAVLDPLAALAERTNTAILCVTHFGKAATADTGRAVLGSAAWSQVPRSVLAIAADETNGGVLVTNTKSNLAARTVTRPARLVDALVPIDGQAPARVATVQWGEVTDRDARDLLDADTADTRATRRGIDTWLRDQLTPGAAWFNDLKADVQQSGWSVAQMRDAKTRLGVQAKKIGRIGWAWHLPGTDPQPVATPQAAQSTSA